MNKDFQLMRRPILYRGTWRKRPGPQEWQAAINQGRRRDQSEFSALVFIATMIALGILTVILAH